MQRKRRHSFNELQAKLLNNCAIVLLIKSCSCEEEDSRPVLLSENEPTSCCCCICLQIVMESLAHICCKIMSRSGFSQNSTHWEIKPSWTRLHLNHQRVFFAFFNGVYAFKENEITELMYLIRVPNTGTHFMTLKKNARMQTKSC